jgi:hypothetical protein
MVLDARSESFLAERSRIRQRTYCEYIFGYGKFFPSSLSLSLSLSKSEIDDNQKKLVLAVACADHFPSNMVPELA